MGSIRFLLALAVIIVHSSSLWGLQLVPGYLAVQAFYIISGFLMAFVYNEKYVFTKRPVYLFLSNRFLKLYPLYIFCVFLVAALGLAFGLILNDWGKFRFYQEIYTASPQSLGALVTIFLTNITLVGQDIVTFFSINMQSGNLQFNGLQHAITIQELLFISIAWTVGVEILFYFMSPLILTKRIRVILLTIGGVILLRILLYYFGGVRDNLVIYRFAPTEFFWFLLGVLAYKLEKIGRFPGKNHGVLLLCTLVPVLILYRYIPAPLNDIVVYSLVFFSSAAIFYRFSANKFDKLLGDLCYPMYLGHGVLLLIVNANSFPKQFGTGIPLVTMTIIFSVLVNKFFLQPFDRFRQRRVAKVSKSGQPVSGQSLSGVNVTAPL